MANEISLELREKVKNFALEAVKEADDEIELVDVAFYKQYGKLTVEALLWKKSGIDLNDCRKSAQCAVCKAGYDRRRIR